MLSIVQSDCQKGESMRGDGMGLNGLVETRAPLRGVEAQIGSPASRRRYRDVSRSIHVCVLH